MVEQQNTANDQPVRIRIRVRRKRRKKSKRRYIFLGIVLFLFVLSTVFSLVGYLSYNSRYRRDLALAQAGVQDLRSAQDLLVAYPKNFFDERPVSQARQEFASASANFLQLEDELRSLPSAASSVPIFGARLRSATRLLPLATEIAQAGLMGCDTLHLLITRFHNPISSEGQGLTPADFTLINQNFHRIETLFAQVVAQVNQLQPSDLQVEPHLSKLLENFRKGAPAIQAMFATVEKALPVIPTLLGVGKPTHYLVELLDSTELRPGGGFVGNYGIAEASGGRLISAHITDTYLLDKAFIAAGNHIPFPAAYTWFDLSPEGWSLRDSNLDADFPTDARNAEQLYAREGGITPLQGVIAITPAFIEHALTITGPISVPEYHEVVTAQNLINRIHHYQLEVTDNGKGLAPSPDGHSSLRKHFTALLAEHFVARFHQLPSSSVSRFIQLFIGSLHTKDLQVYFNSNVAEAFLQQLRLDDSITAPNSDTLFVVNANISPNKANSMITSTLSDQVAIDVHGNAVHHTTITYGWHLNGRLFGSTQYRDYVRVYTPQGSVLRSQSGWYPSGTSVAFGHEVWSGLFTLSLDSVSNAGTITLVWIVPGAARKDARGWHYQDLLQKQAGMEWNVNLQITLPGCAVIQSKQGGLVSNNKSPATFDRALSQDVMLGIEYSC